MKHILYFIGKIHSFSGKILYLNLIGMILISLFEGIGIFLLVPLINLTGMLEVKTGESSAINWIFGLFQDLPETTSLLIILGLYILLIISQSFFQRNQMILNVKIQQGFMRQLRTETYRALLQAKWEFFLHKRKSDIINIMTTETNRVSGGIHLILQFAASIIFTFIQIGLAFWLSAQMTIFVLFFGLLLMLSSRKFISKSSNIGEETIHLSKTFLAGITDQFNGIKEIKSNTLEETHLNWFSSMSQRMEQNIIKFAKVKTTSTFIFKVVSAFLIALFIFFSITLLKARPTELMLIIIIFSRLWPRFSGIQSNLEQISSMIPSFKVLLDLQKDCLAAMEIPDNEFYKAEPLWIKHSLECQNVTFRYNLNNPKYALNNVNLHIPSNCMTAIVGRSGAGKSTLIDIIMGLNQPERGQVLVDGIRLTSERLLSLRRSVSYVPQDPFLFNASIKENLLLVKPDASEEQIWESLEFSSAAEFVKKLPQGLDTLIGDRGIRLSGGERQRIVLARAILRKPSILVLDEATSALDTENEAKIQKALERLKGKLTIIVIAHRLSTIRNADQVVVLDDGQIIQKGAFGQLASDENGMFSSLLSKQMVAK